MSLTVGIVGGTGAEGRGLALRFVRAGRSVIIGSRDAPRAEAAAAEINELAGSALARGTRNTEAARDGELIILTIPFEGLDETVLPLAESVAGTTVVSTIVPLEFAGGRPRVSAVAEGSAAERLQRLLADASVVAAFHHLSAPTLADLEHPIGGDVLICGDNAEAKRQVAELAETLPEVRCVDAGPLDGAFYLEAFTAVLVRINRRYHAHTGVRITQLPERG